MRTILITGGGGFLGRALLNNLLADYRVIVYDKFFFGHPLPHPRLITVEGDTRAIEKEHFEGVDIVMDLACISNDPSCDLNIGLTYSTNLEGALRTAEMAKAAGVKRYIYSSTCSVYGEGKRENLTESSPTSPITYYAKSKLAAETEILQLSDSAFRVVAVRSGTMFGLSSSMRFDLIVNTMSKAAWINKEITVNDGTQWRPLIHIKDVARAFRMFAENKEVGIFNSGGINYRVIQVAEYVKSTFNANINRISANKDKRNYNVSSAKIEALGFNPKIDVYMGAKEIRRAFNAGIIQPDDPFAVRLQRYRDLYDKGQLGWG